MKSYNFRMISTAISLNGYVVLDNVIETLRDFSKHKGGLATNLGITWFEYHVVKLGEDTILISSIHGTGVYHGPEPIL